MNHDAGVASQSSDTTSRPPSEMESHLQSTDQHKIENANAMDEITFEYDSKCITVKFSQAGAQATLLGPTAFTSNVFKRVGASFVTESWRLDFTDDMTSMSVFLQGACVFRGNAR